MTIDPHFKNRKRRKQAPTLKQITALQYIQQGMSKRKAMLKAGYSTYMANTGRIMKMAGTRSAVESMQRHLEEKGLTTEKMAEKFAEWLDAKKVVTSHTEPDREVPDYDIQIKTYDRWNKIIAPVRNDEGQVKRKITLEEFVMPEGEKDVTDL